MHNRRSINFRQVRRATHTENDLHSQRGDLDAAVPLCQPVAILPDGIEELGRIDSDLVQNNAIARRNVLDQHMNASIESKDQTGILSIQCQISSGQQDFAWRRDGDRSVVTHPVG